MEKVVAIHQPNYLPWLGYFYKLMHSNIFVYLDNVPYEKNGYTNRNLIKTAQGTQWLTVGVLTKGHFGQAINELKINNNIDWNTNHWKSIMQNYSHAPFFNYYKEEFNTIYKQKWDSLAVLNEILILTCCKMLKITNVEFIRASSLNTSGKSTELLIDICHKVGVDNYLSGFGGAKYMEEDKFIQAGIKISCYDFVHPVYQQLWGNFVPNLSILDLLFNEGENSHNILKRAHR
jgi:hypothetical protein